MPLKPMARKETFWNEERVKQNIYYKDLAEYCNCPISTIGSYFSGQLMPPDNVIEKICELFGVDTIKGTHEFLSAHKKWDADRHTKAYLKGEREAVNKKAVKNTADKKEEPKAEEVKTEENTKSANTNEAFYEYVFECTYGQITSYSQFLELSQLIANSEEPINILKWLYSKVEFEVYNKIYCKAMEDKNGK